MSPKSAFEVGVIFNPRVTFKVNRYNNVSIGIDVGWYRDTFKFQTGSQNFTHEFDTVMTGLNFRWSPSLFVLGIGGGVKFPFLGKYWVGNSDTALSGGNFIPNMQIKDNLASLGEGYSYPGKLGSVDIGVQVGIHLDIFEFGENNNI